MTLLIFDCDGTLTDTELLHAEINCEFLSETYGIRWDVRAANRRFVGANLDYFEQALEQELGHPLPTGHRERFLAYKNERFVKRVVPVPHVFDALGELTSYPKAVASNLTHQALCSCLMAAGLSKYFGPNVFSVERVQRGKPSPDLFLLVAREFHVDPDNCIVIEDSNLGIEAAHSAGMSAIGFAGGSHCYAGYAEERLSQADRVISDMRDLPALVRAIDHSHSSYDRKIESKKSQP